VAAHEQGDDSAERGPETVGDQAVPIKGGPQLARPTAGPGKGGDISASVANGVTLSGTGPDGASGITAAAKSGSSGRAGTVVLTAVGRASWWGGGWVRVGEEGGGQEEVMGEAVVVSAGG